MHQGSIFGNRRKEIRQVLAGMPLDKVNGACDSCEKSVGCSQGPSLVLVPRERTRQLFPGQEGRQSTTITYARIQLGSDEVYCTQEGIEGPVPRTGHCSAYVAPNGNSPFHVG